MDYDPIELNDARVYSLQNVYRLNAKTTFSRKQNRIEWHELQIYFYFFCPFSSLSFKKIRCFHLFCNCVDFVSILFYISSLSQFEIKKQVFLSNVRHVVIIFSLITLIRGEQSNHIYGKIDYWAKRTKVETHEIKCFNLKQKFICVAPDS